MATKKQKHEAALAKRARFLEAAKRDGLEAQRKDREYRERRKQIVEEEAQERDRRTKARIAEHDIHKNSKTNHGGEQNE